MPAPQSRSTHFRSFIEQQKQAFWRCLLVTILCLPALAHANLQATDEQREAAEEVSELLATEHYADVEFSDKLMTETLDEYLKMLDPNRAYVLADQVKQWHQQKDDIRHALQQGELDLPFDIFQTIHQAQQARLEAVINRLTDHVDSFHFDQNIRFQPDRREAEWATDQSTLDTYWDYRLTNELLSIMENSDKSSDEAAAQLLKRYKQQQRRLEQTNNEDVFQSFMNAFTTSIDPHTNYFSPRRTENFNIQMKLSLDGIGAMLQAEDDFTKVVSLVPGGPADKQGDLKPADRILAVGQGDDGELVNVTGWRLDEVVDLIRGERGSIVRLQVQHGGKGPTKVISITRNAVQLEDQAASKQMIDIEQDGQTHKVGVIKLPTFYLDFEGAREGRKDYRSTTRDVTKLIQELEEEGMESLVIDLRNNGGGALQEANSLVGLFIKRGPTVQVRDADGEVSILGDRDGKVFYDGPMAVLVNRMSASASEIFAAAIQDYGRGLIIGEPSFGKGTVQSLVNLNHGQLKLTRAKFYRISGGSTQEKGVVPDIQYPKLIDPKEIGESALPHALPWDQVRPVIPPREHGIKDLLPALREQHQARITHDPNFNYLREQSDWLQSHSGSPTVSLNQTVRHEEHEAEEQSLLEMENKRRAALDLAPLKSLDDKPDEDITEEDKDSPLDQAVLSETGRILLDAMSMASPD